MLPPLRSIIKVNLIRCFFAYQSSVKSLFNLITFFLYDNVTSKVNSFLCKIQENHYQRDLKFERIHRDLQGYNKCEY